MSSGSSFNPWQHGRKILAGIVIAASFGTAGYYAWPGGTPHHPGGVVNPQTAHLWVATDGSASCTRNSSSVTYSDAVATGNVCATLAKVCSLASGGDTIYVQPGDYGTTTQDISSCTGKTSTVTISAVAGSYCPYSAATVPSSLPAQNADTSCPVTMGKLNAVGNSVSDPSTSTLKNLKFVGIYFGEGGTGINLNYVHGFTFQHVAAPDLVVGASDSVTFQDGDLGNRFDGNCPVVSNLGTGTPDSTNVTISGSLIHDEMRLTSAQGHPDGLFIQGLNGGAITGNVFYRDAVIPLYLNSVTGGSIANITVTNNVLHRTVDMTDTGSSTVSTAISQVQTISLGDNDMSNVTVAFNSVSGSIRRQDLSTDGTGTTTNLRVYGNIAQSFIYGSAEGCASSTTYDYNYFYGGTLTCGANDADGTGSSPFTSDDDSPNSATPGTFTLRATTTPVGMVSTTWCSANPNICPATDIAGATRPSASHSTAINAGAYENR